MNTKQLVIIEDDILLAKQLKEIFELSDYDVKVFNTAEDYLFSKAGLNSPAIYLIDLNLPGLMGIDLMKVIRHQDKFSAIFVITGESALDAVKKSLTAGADDFISKPFNPEHLLLKVKNAHAKLQLLRSSMIDVGVKLVPDACLVSRNGHKMKLTNREYAIIKKLLSTPDEIFSREVLVKEMRDNDITERTVDVHVSSLRRKLSKLGLKIETIRGKGYRVSGLEMKAVSL